MAPKDRPSFERVRDDIIATVQRILPGLLDEFEACKRDDPQRARSSEFQFASNKGELGPGDQPFPSAAIKFLIHAREHIDKFRLLLPHISQSRRALEIGVGPGYLQKVLVDHVGCDAYGLDLPRTETYVYDVIRKALGVADRTLEHQVFPREPVPIRAGTDLIVGYLPVFHSKWHRADHLWFWDFCRERMAGEKKLVFVFNQLGFTTREEVRALYLKHAEFPLSDESQALSKLFCVLRL